MAHDSENVSPSNGSISIANRSAHSGNQDGTLINFNSNEMPTVTNNQYPHLPPVPPRSFEVHGVKS